MGELRPFSSPEELAEAIKHSAFQGKWEEVVAIAPLAAKMDGDVLVDCLYNSTKSTNPNIKDGAMIIWSYLNPKNYNTKHIHWGEGFK